MELLPAVRPINHGSIKQEHHLCGTITLFVDEVMTYSRRFNNPKSRNKIIDSWYNLNPSIKKHYHYFEVQYDY